MLNMLCVLQLNVSDVKIVLHASKARSTGNMPLHYWLAYIWIQKKKNKAQLAYAKPQRLYLEKYVDSKLKNIFLLLFFKLSSLLVYILVPTTNEFSLVAIKSGRHDGQGWLI
jgi:hypothetical protein